MTPKEQFLTSAHREPLEKWATTASGQSARDTALLQFVHEQPGAIDPSRAWDQHCQLVGARRILEILFNLWAKDEPSKGMKLPVLKPPS